jgi:hypothetical protein
VFLVQNPSRKDPGAVGGSPLVALILCWRRESALNPARREGRKPSLSFAEYPLMHRPMRKSTVVRIACTIAIAASCELPSGAGEESVTAARTPTASRVAFVG